VTLFRLLKIELDMLKGNNINILLVEDNPGDIRLAREAFYNAGISDELFVATDGEEAIKFLFQTPPYADVPKPHLILLDLNLPKKSGKEILKVLKDDPTLSVIPVLILSTSKSQSDILWCYEHHANSYFSKPLDFDVFSVLIKSISQYWFEHASLTS